MTSQPPYATQATQTLFSRLGRSATLKLFFLGFLILCFLLPLAFVKGVIQDRVRYKNEASRDIAESWAGEQVLYGPVLILPYSKTTRHEYFDHKTQTTKVRDTKTNHYKFALPKTATADADVSTQERYRGIYTVPVYENTFHMSGAFSGLGSVIDALNAPDIEVGTPHLSFGLSDMRGISEQIDIQLNGQSLDVLPGSNLKNDSNGIHAFLDVETMKADDLTFDVDMRIKGIKSFSFIPVGKETKFSMTSSWADPSFSGRFLPTNRAINDDGFSSHWSTSELATNMSHHFESCLYKNDCHDFKQQNYSVQLYQTSDVYQQSIKAVKYGILFLSLTFFVFFIYEVMKKMRIHPVQYILVGSALATFFLLLVSLSEHLSFFASYVIATLSIVVLLGYYIAHVLRGTKMGVFFGVMIAGLYTVLYFILQSQDYALLTGTVFLLAVLAGVMIVTRKMDWYNASIRAE